MGELEVALGYETVVEIGGMPILVRTESPEFFEILRNRYVGYVREVGLHRTAASFDIEIVPSGPITGEDELSVRFENGRWVLERGDLHGEWDPESLRGRIRQSANPYSIDAAMRIVHSLMLAKQGGLLVHASSAVRNGRAFLFTGVSGAGKTTISRLAPHDVSLLTDEISYLRREGDGYMAFGTPFHGELARPGDNIRAPLAAVYLLAKGDQNTIERVAEADAARSLLKSILFFAHDSELVGFVFGSACELVRRVPIYRLTFVPDSRVWELIV